MKISKIFVCLFIVILMAFPALASDVTINRWVLDVTMNEDGVVNELMQIEMGNAGSLPIDGFSFVVPASQVTVLYDFDHTFSSKGQVVEQTKVRNGTKLTVKFNSSLDSGDSWGGRIGFKAENFTKRSGDNYTIEIPLNIPQAVTSGKSEDMKISPDVDLRCQVFLPKGIEIISATPEPFRILFQNSIMVPTWTSTNIHFTDTINIEGSFSDILDKIADVDKRSKALSERIKEASTNGTDVGEAQAHLKNAENLSTNGVNSALSFFRNKDSKAALELVGRAEDELNMTENSLPSSGETRTKPTEMVVTTPKKSPGVETACLISIIICSFMVLRTRREH